MKLWARRRPVVRAVVAPSVRYVGVCGACGGPVLWSSGTGAECPCGMTVVPEAFFRAGRWGAE